VPKPTQQRSLFEAEAVRDSFVPNSAQARAIEHEHGPMLVLAGAGTGKTTVLTRRIARLLERGIARPDQVLAITFTNKAAYEIRKRVTHLVGDAAGQGIQASTFHSYCWKLLKRNGESLELIGPEQFWVLLRQRLGDLPLREFLKAAEPGRFLRDLREFMDRCNDELVSPTEFAGYVQQARLGKCEPMRVFRSKDEPAREETLARMEEISAVYAAADAMLEREGLLTIGSIMPRAIQLLKRRAELLGQERERAQFLLVDEFQDCNHAQLELARLLGGERQNVFAVGDPDQAIYRFRGASSAAFEDFVGLFTRLAPETIVNLAENQRSTSQILSTAYDIIRVNPDVASHRAELNAPLKRVPLVSARAARGETREAPVELVPCVDYAGEAADIAGQIEQLRKQEVKLGDIAVMYRSHGARRDVVRELRRRGIPFVFSGANLFDTEVLRDAIAALKCLPWPEDDIELFRLALMPRWGIDPRDLHRALLAAPRSTRVLRTLQQVPGASDLLRALDELRSEVRAAGNETLRAVEAALRWIGADSSQAEAKRFREFARAASESRFPAAKRLVEFLQYLELYRMGEGKLAPTPVEQDPLGDGYVEEERSANSVQLLTVHTAKGLEWPHVFVLRVSDQSFPALYRESLFEFPQALRRFKSNGAEEKAMHAAEERRLFYVAATRAKDRLSFYGKLRFGELPGIYLRELAPAGPASPRAVRPAAPVFLPNSEPMFQSWVETGCTRERSLVLSASAIEQYLRCPMQYRIQREWKLPDDAGAPLQYGAAMHTALKDYFDAQGQGRPRSTAETIGVFQEQFKTAAIPDALQRRLYEEQGIQQLTAFVAAQQGRPQPKVVATEQAFQIKVNGVEVRGRIDRVDELPGGGIAVTDYKTGAPRTEQDASSSQQLRIYALASQELFGKIPAQVLFYNLEDNSEATTTLSPKKLENAREKILKVAADIAAERFEAKPDHFTCRFCGYRSVCPETVEPLEQRQQRLVALEA
jgi:DNA helicase-2/ATP-dependent DNA helicase PcrA